MFCCNLSHFEMTFLFCFGFFYLIKKAGVELTTVTLLEVLE